MTQSETTGGEGSGDTNGEGPSLIIRNITHTVRVKGIPGLDGYDGIPTLQGGDQPSNACYPGGNPKPPTCTVSRLIADHLQVITRKHRELLAQEIYDCLTALEPQLAEDNVSLTDLDIQLVLDVQGG